MTEELLKDFTQSLVERNEALRLLEKSQRISNVCFTVSSTILTVGASSLLISLNSKLSFDIAFNGSDVEFKAGIGLLILGGMFRVVCNMVTANRLKKADKCFKKSIEALRDVAPNQIVAFVIPEHSGGKPVRRVARDVLSRFFRIPLESNAL